MSGDRDSVVYPFFKGQKTVNKILKIFSITAIIIETVTKSKIIKKYVLVIETHLC